VVLEILKPDCSITSAFVLAVIMHNDVETTVHTARTSMQVLGTSMQVLKAMFAGRITSHFKGITWSTSFTHLARPKYILWGYVKSKVQKMPSANTDRLKTVNLKVYSRDTKGNVTTCNSTLSNTNAGVQQVTLWSPTKVSYSNIND